MSNKTTHKELNDSNESLYILQLDIDNWLDSLSEIDRDICLLLNMGYKHKEVASMIGININTITRHKNRIKKSYQKNFR